VLLGLGPVVALEVVAAAAAAVGEVVRAAPEVVAVCSTVALAACLAAGDADDGRTSLTEAGPTLVGTLEPVAVVVRVAGDNLHGRMEESAEEGERVWWASAPAV